MRDGIKRRYISSRTIVGSLLIALCVFGSTDVRAQSCTPVACNSPLSPYAGLSGNDCGATIDPIPALSSNWFTAQQPGYCAAMPCAPSKAAYGSVFGGFEFLWMRANFDQNVAMVIDPPVGNTLVPFDYSYDLTPRAWLGWQSCRGGGVRGTYFRFNSEADTETVTAAAGSAPVFVYVYGAGGNLSRNAQAVVGETLQSQHRLKLEAFDLEAIQRFNWYSLRGTVGGGLRIAQMNQRLRGDVYDSSGALDEAVSNDLKFEGAGPTVSLQAYRSIAASRLAFYSGLRGSMLMGETEQKIYEMKGAFTTELEDTATQREVLTVAEMAIGLQWNQSFGERSYWFARAGYEVQAWFDAGGPVDSHSTISLDAISLALGIQF